MTAAPSLSSSETFAISFIQSKFDNRPQIAAVTWKQLCGEIAKPRRTACTVSTCATGEHAERDQDGSVLGCRHKNGRAWIPATFSTGRKKATVKAVSVLVVDADHLPDAAALEAVLAKLERYRYVAHATHSDRAGDRCARIALPLTRPVPGGDWPRFWPAAMALLGMPADPSCCDAGRLYYLPARPSDADYWFVAHDGEPLDVLEIVKNAPAQAPSIAATLGINDEGVVGPGQRHAMLKSLAGAMRKRGCGLAAIEAALVLANQHQCNPPKPDGEVKELAAWAAEQPVTTLPPRSNREPQLGTSEEPNYDDIPPPNDADAPVDELRARRSRERTSVAVERGHPGYSERGGYRLTELGNARRFADLHGERWRFDHDRVTWLEWAGTHWCPDTTGAARRAARGVVASIYADIAALSMRTSQAVNGGESVSSTPIDEMQKWARASSKRAAIEAMLALAATEPEIAARSSLFDADPWAFNVANGTIDLREGELRPHRQSDMLAKIAPVDYDPRAEAPQWERFLTRVLPDTDVLAWVQRYLGYTLTGDVREQCLAFFVGGGANGKSVLLDVVLAIVGDYGLRAAPDLVVASHNERHPTELADLDGRRLAVCSEIEQGRAWAESTIKRITGDTTITARRMRADFYSFPATHKIIVAANTRPVVRGTDDGIWRRMRLVPWDVRIPDAEQDRELAQRLIATEASGILAWLVRGCVAWQRQGLGTPAAIAEATDSYRADQDLLGRWIEDRCEQRAELWQATTSLYTNYTEWCETEGIEAWTQPTWRARMIERRGVGASRREHGRVRVLTGLAVRSLP